MGITYVMPAPLLTPCACPPALQVSNRDVEEDDYERWQRHCKLSNREPVTRAEVQQAVSQIKEVRSSLVPWHVQGHWSPRMLRWGEDGLMLPAAGWRWCRAAAWAAGAVYGAHPDLIPCPPHHAPHWHQSPCLACRRRASCGAQRTCGGR